MSRRALVSRSAPSSADRVDGWAGSSQTGGVLALGAGVIHSLTALLSQAVVALLLGLICGVGLLIASRSSFRLVKAEKAAWGVALVSLLLFARMGVAAVLLWAYHRFLEAGFVPFAAGFAGGFFVAYGVALARYAGVLRTRTR